MSKRIMNQKFEKRFPEFDSEFWNRGDLSVLRRFAYSITCKGSAEFRTEGTPRYVESDLEPDSRPKWLQILWPFRSSKKYKPWDYVLHSSPAYVPIITPWQHWMVLRALKECSDWSSLFRHEDFLSALKYVDEDGNNEYIIGLESEDTNFAPWLYGGDLFNASRYKEECESMWRSWDVEDWVAESYWKISNGTDFDESSVSDSTDLGSQVECLEKNFPDNGKAPKRGGQRHVLARYECQNTSNLKCFEDRHKFEPEVGSVLTLAGGCAGVTHLTKVEIEPESIKLADLDMTFTDFQKMYNEIEPELYL